MAFSSFAKLGICKEILEVIQKCNWTHPTDIQVQAIPAALRGQDIVGVAETGSGKTAAFAIPILQNLIAKPRHNFALVLAPTRELASQLKAQFLDLGGAYGLKVLCLVGGQHVEDQYREMKNSKYHVIIGTPGRIVFHLENSKELRLTHTRYLVLDEADQMFDDTFENHLTFILSKLPSSHRTYLYSATMSPEVKKVQEICAKSPVIVQAAPTLSKVKKLDHAFVFLPDQERDVYVVYLLSTASKASSANKTIVFTTTWRESFRIAAMLKLMGPMINGSAAALNGNMKQDKRQEVLFNFRSGETSILVATDLASRGLDIPEVDLIINYDVPRRPSWSDSAKAYIHRVGRTARAGRLGRAITLVTPYSATRLKAIESALGERVPQLPWPGTSCVSMDLREQVMRASKQARANLRESDKKKRILKKNREKARKAEAFASTMPIDDSDDVDNQ